MSLADFMCCKLTFQSWRGPWGCPTLSRELWRHTRRFCEAGSVLQFCIAPELTQQRMDGHACGQVENGRRSDLWVDERFTVGRRAGEAIPAAVNVPK